MKEKNEKGITLIALVVAIVVLLILAGITINLLFSNGGIFDIANQAKVEHEIGALKDRINNVIADWSIGRAIDPTVTVDDLWDKMVEADIIDNPKEDVSGPKKEGENDRYEITTNEGYIVEIIISPDGNVSIGDAEKGDKLSPKIGEITSTSESNSIHIEVEIARSEGEVSLSYYYKKDGEAEDSYKALKEEVTDLTADFTELEQNVVYNIKVVIKDNNGTSEKEINVTTGELTGTVTQKGETIWRDGTATIELETIKTGVTIQYQVDTTEGQWIDYEGPITGLHHGETVYAVTTNGTNQSGHTSIDILDQVNPQNAQIELSETSSTTTGSITATITHIDNESGVELTKCKWIYNTDQNPIGTEESSYSNTFSDSQPITLSAATAGTYYLHVLTIDVAGNKTETISQGITVTQLVTDITVSPTSVTLEEGQTRQLSATITPNNASNQNITWSSNSGNVANVSSSGLVTAKSVGTATITVTANDGSGKQATCSVTVKSAIPTVEETLKEGDYVTYKDGKGISRKCIVLYDNSSNYGVEIIAMETVEDVTLGDDANFNTAMDSYNNAIKTLNSRASAYNNSTYSTRARCVGSVPNNPNSESGMNMTEFGKNYNGKLKDKDDNYLIDSNKMDEIEGVSNIGKDYWLASRYLYPSPNGINLNVCYITYRGKFTNTGYLCVIDDDTASYFQSVTCGLRPVFHLKSNIKVTGGNGSADSPYTLGI